MSFISFLVAPTEVGEKIIKSVFRFFGRDGRGRDISEAIKQRKSLIKTLKKIMGRIL
jgi:hypothetical protein